jgi:hypothetical protein
MTDQRMTPQAGQAIDGPPAGTPVIVEVLARTGADGSVEFSHDWRWQNGMPGGGSGAIEVPKRGKDEDGTLIHFHLRDETQPNRGLDFTDDIQGAMWVKRENCPDERSEDPEIPPGQMDASPNLLKVFDKNSEECTLHYRLRFKDRHGNAVSYDPDIKNGGTNLDGGGQ